MKKPKSILITGASSGLGAELARQYAEQGISLFLVGRSKQRLLQVQKACEAQGAKVTISLIDVIDSQKLKSFIEDSNNTAPIDLVIANAGISAGTGGGGEGVEQARKIFDTNLYGVINTIHPAIDLMKKRGKGQVAIMGSLAGYRGLPSAPAYSASKSAVKTYGEALRGDLKGGNVELTVITPGYIKTPMTDANKFYMPFLMDAPKAAKVIKKRLKRNPARIAFPFPLYFLVWLISCLSPAITDPIFTKLPKKE